MVDLTARSNVSDDVIKGIATGALGLLGTVITVVVTWAKDRNAASERVRALDEAMKRMAFWDSWLKTAVSVNPQADISLYRYKAYQELATLATAIESTYKKPPEVEKTVSGPNAHESYRKSLPVLRRWLLLYRPPRARAWVTRIFFYCAVSGLIFVPIMVSSDNDSVPGDVLGGFLGALFYVLIFRALSIWLEKPKANSV